VGSKRDRGNCCTLCGGVGVWNQPCWLRQRDCLPPKRLEASAASPLYLLLYIPLLVHELLG
jgi:hypothetical protein